MIESITMATAGGVLIGLAASLLLLANGRIAGISGIVGELFKRTSPDSSWRALFVIGLVAGTGCVIFSKTLFELKSEGLNGRRNTPAAT